MVRSYQELFALRIIEDNSRSTEHNSYPSQFVIRRFLAFLLACTVCCLKDQLSNTEATESTIFYAVPLLY